MFWNVQFLAHVQTLTFAHVAMPFARYQQHQATAAASESAAGPTRSCRLNAKAASSSTLLLPLLHLRCPEAQALSASL